MDTYLSIISALENMQNRYNKVFEYTNKIARINSFVGKFQKINDTYQRAIKQYQSRQDFINRIERINSSIGKIQEINDTYQRAIRQFQSRQEFITHFVNPISSICENNQRLFDTIYPQIKQMDIGFSGISNLSNTISGLINENDDNVSIGQNIILNDVEKKEVINCIDIVTNQNKNWEQKLAAKCSELKQNHPVVFNIIISILIYIIMPIICTYIIDTIKVRQEPNSNASIINEINIYQINSIVNDKVNYYYEIEFLDNENKMQRAWVSKKKLNKYIDDLNLK